MWIGVLCALLGGLAGRWSASPPRSRPAAPTLDPEAERLISAALEAGRASEALRQRASESADTQRRADEAASRTYPDREPARPSAPDRRLPPARRLPAPPTTPATPPEPSLPVAAEVTDLTPLPDSIGNLYFIALYRNTGEAVIDLPRAELTLWGREGQKLATATGFTPRHQLPRGEATPLKVLFTHAPAYATVTVHVDPQRERYPRRRPRLELRDIRFARDRYGGYRITGTVHNRGDSPAQYVQLIALFYDAQDHLAGMDSRFTAQRLLPGGESTPFEVPVALVRGVPTRVQLDYQALEVPPGKPR